MSAEVICEDCGRPNFDHASGCPWNPETSWTIKASDDPKFVAQEIISEEFMTPIDAVSPPTVPDDAVDIMRECEKCGGVECECRAPLEGVQETIDLMAALKSSLEKTAAERIAALESDVARLTRERDEWEQAAKNAGLAAAIAMQRTEELVGKLADARKKNGGSP